MGKQKLNSLFRVVVTISLSLVLMNTNFSFAGNASEVEFHDHKQNSWISVSGLAKQGEVHFQWLSTLQDVQVQITGPRDFSISGGQSGEISVVVPSGNAQGEYKFEATRPVDEHHGSQGQNVSPLYLEYVTSLSLGALDPAASLLVTQRAQASGQAAKTYLRYQTFIPDSYLGAPSVACTPDSNDYLFAGDGRDFDPSSSSFRTRFQVTVDWLANGTQTFSRSVGPTKRYLMANNGLPIMSSETTATATNEGMVLTAKSSSSTLAHYTLTHSVTNPMCNTMVTYPIWYRAEVWIARSGAFTVTNEYRRAPNHELYLKDSDQANWTTLLQSPTYSMNCLDATGKTQFYCSGNFNSIPGSSR